MKNRAARFALGLLFIASTVAAQPKYVLVNLGLGGGAATSSIANGMNNAGQVVGFSMSGTLTAPSGCCDYRIWRTMPNAPINPATDLIPLLPGGTSGRVFSINNSGQVTG